MRVFISHTNDAADIAFSRALTELLKAVRDPRIDVWFDEESLPKIGRLDDTLRDSIGKCDYAIFVVSQGWANHNYPHWELEQFVRKDPALARTIAILRAPRDLLEIPSPLDL